ncbi:uncharacterized protein LOC135162480 isoform X5 [Diachasmimorpha longicaudata]
MVNQYGPPQNSYNLQMYGQSAINQQQMPQQMQQQLQQQMQFQSDQTSVEEQRAPLGASIRRNSRILTQQDRPVTGIGQTLNDRLDHYKRPPSRDSSVDRYRVPTRLIGSRQPSVDKSITSQDGVDRTVRGGSLMRSATPLNGSVFGSGAVTPIYTPPTSSQFDIAFKSRGLGQEVIPSGSQPKRTESLYVTPARTLGISSGSGSGGAGGGGGMRAIPVNSMPLQRKKSLPDVAGPIQLTATSPLSREEVSVLSSMRREEIRRQIDESERLRANPLLYLVSPQVKDWFSRQQLVMLVLFINISLALMFFKLLT